MNPRPLLLATLALACTKAAPPAPAPEAPAPPAFVAPERTRPAPLAAPTLRTPPIQRGRLANGLEVLVVPNHEVPLFTGRLVVRVGVDADPKGKEGTGSVTFDLLDQGAGGRTASEIASATKRLGGEVSSGAGRDVGQIGVSGPVENLAALVDLWATVALRPDFPEDEWSVAQARRIADLKARAEDPAAIAGRAGAHLTWGNTYTGRLITEAAYGAITRNDLVAHHKKVMAPENAVLLIGGDVELDAVLPVLESAFGAWEAKAAKPLPPPAPATFKADTIYVIDKPGAAQTVVQAILPVNDRSQPDWHALSLANTMFGGAFTARVNMNLREEKGWTYGARCGLDDGIGPTVWACSTNVQTDKTVPALLELRRELTEALSTRPFTPDELTFFRGYRTNALYGRYETPSALLGELLDIWTYRLPADWIDRTIPALQAVDLPTAQAAWSKWIQPGRVAWLLVGDAARFSAELEAVGTPVVRLDRDGNPLR